MNGSMSKGDGMNNKMRGAMAKPAKGAKPAPHYPKVGTGMAPNWKKANTAGGKGVNRRA